MASNVLEYRPPKADRKVLTWAYIRPTIILACILIPVECLCAYLTYYTIGELASMGCFLILVFANLVALTMLFIDRRLARIGLVLIGLFIIPAQTYLGLKWIRAHVESNRIMEYVEQSKTATGQYPKNLNGYRARDPWIIISYGSTADGKAFSLGFFLGSTNTGHTYTSVDGWFYYPD